MHKVVPILITALIALAAVAVATRVHFIGSLVFPHHPSLPQGGP
jgi:hypothetical protein